MRGLFILGDGFEDTEAIATIDVLRRAKLEVTCASMEDNLEVKTQTGLTVKADMLISDVKVEDYNFLVIPGGRAVFNVLDKSTILSEIILDFADKDKLIASICAGPSQVGKLGLFAGKDYTCFPTTEASITRGNLQQDRGVVVSDNYITAKAMGYSIDFGLAIVEYLLGKNVKENVRKAIYGER
jgi:4-methyl-5(b-hydroxyethyl)-thiazole monophosphate biosynthesis